MKWRTAVRESDSAAVRELVAATGFFTDEEVEVAVELVDETLANGKSSGYEFVFADAPDDSGRLLGYTCFGAIPMTVSSCDLYWIAVAPGKQRSGLGGQLIRESERLAKGLGTTQMFVDTAGREKYAPTRAFYERCGYRKAAVLDDFYAPGDAKVIYAKTL
ncbi:MAG: GNAT family N-acetyltransferase [Gammaproteobacteria bacterium]|nr:GNAT family N-acetyltransferase [Gammaproteobacteria bacterium]MDH4314692.1 GNAT family N-acetyltransferase [Gammaproteobacteria bacterium]MDH5214974.1 GNAT family N-acetyltransferase [Gammaproteobacteria bacterium]MDH5500594.1 GNAT family N-acetyltransferase [Gammaproteobacteria bacterium]